MTHDPTPETRRLEGAPAWGDAVAEVLLAATAAGATARRLLAVAPDFEAWPWERPDLASALVPWLKRPGRELTLLLADPTAWLSRSARFDTWRRDWMHAIHIRAVSEDEGGRLPEFIAADGGPWAQLQERDPWRGFAGGDGRRASQLLQSVDAQLQRSSPAGAVKVLGL
jgi:hypothetical protein